MWVMDVLRSVLKDLLVVGTSPRVMLMSLVLSAVCFLSDNDTRCLWLTLGLATSALKTLPHDVSHGRGGVCGVNGIEICLMRLLSLSGCVLSSVDTGYGDLCGVGLVV